ncbi:uncharacterized protein CTRU02_212276 [Colletotrichum truncatum]|uniref:Uncharacterized protein n=1 Tax=Colletotrichum truncatum TaxID=5467 RepID=A0ACC3YN35_COLTU
MQFNSIIIAISVLAATAVADYQCYTGHFTCVNACKGNLEFILKDPESLSKRMLSRPHFPRHGCNTNDPST